MAGDERNDQQPAQIPESTDDSFRAARQARQDGKTVGEGMHSPDSTEAPLSSRTGARDERALGYGDAQGR